MKDIKESLQSLERKIDFWQSKLNGSKDPVESAILADKISEAREKINKINSKQEYQKISTQIDAPALADRIDENSITIDRGQIMNSNEVFRF